MPPPQTKTERFFVRCLCQGSGHLLSGAWMKKFDSFPERQPACDLGATGTDAHTQAPGGIATPRSKQRAPAGKIFPGLNRA